MKNQDLVKNNARSTNVPTLSESLILEELMFLEESQVLKETVTPKEVWKYKNKEKSINYIYTREIKGS